MIDDNLVKPTVYDKEYMGLTAVPEAILDLNERKVWGKAVVQIVHDEKARL